MRKTSIRILTLGVLALAVACAPAASAPAVAPAPTTAPATPAQSGPPSKPAESKPAAQAESKAPVAKPADNFFAGKTMRIIVGYGPGAAFDRLARVVAKYMPKYIHGNPTVIVENMPGAGSIVSANHIFNVAPKDGTVIGNFNSLLVLQQLTGEQGIEFDVTKFNWLGSLQNTRVACIASRQTGIASLTDIMGPNAKELVMGASGAGSQSYVTPVTLQELGAKIKLVTGYDGAAKIYLAIEQGEIDGTCSTWEAMRVSAQRLFQGDPMVNVFIQMGREKASDLPTVPIIGDFVKTDDQQALLTALSAVDEITRPFALPPDVPPERVSVLRQAFMETMKDPGLNQEAAKAGDELSPSDGETVQTTIATIMRTSPKVVEDLKRVFGP